MGAHIPKIGGASHLKDGFYDGSSVGVVQALTGHHHHAALFPVQTLYICQKLFFVKGPLRQIDEIRPVPCRVSGKGRCRSDPAGIPAHGLDHAHMDGQAAHITAYLPHGVGNVPGSAGKAGCMIGHRQIVVNGLWNSHHADGKSRLTAGFVDFTAGIHGAVAAVAEDIADLVLLQNPGNPSVILLLQHIPGCTDGGCGGIRQQVQFLLGNSEQIQKTLFQNAGGSSQRGIEMVDSSACPGLLHRSVERGIDDCGGGTAVYHQSVGHALTSFPKLFTQIPCFLYRSAISSRVTCSTRGALP